MEEMRAYYHLKTRNPVDFFTVGAMPKWVFDWTHSKGIKTVFDISDFEQCNDAYEQCIKSVSQIKQVFPEVRMAAGFNI